MAAEMGQDEDDVSEPTGTGSTEGKQPPPRPPSGVDSSNLPDRSVHDPAVAHPRGRRRRSQVQIPALTAPVDLPEDAPGRVEFIVVRAPADVDEPLAPPPPPAPSGFSWEVLRVGSGWVAVAVLAVILILIYVVGNALVR
jgi:hypothetical protein